MRNIFCSFSDLTNEASVEAWFINPLLEYLGYNAKDIKLKTSLKKIKVGKGSKAGLYRPDYILSIGSYPSIVIDAKSPTEDISNWTLQCSSYCLELNKLYQHNPVEYYVICNGSSTAVYKWDSNAPLVELEFLDFTTQNQKFIQLTKGVFHFS